jgi:hypothetical protein
MTGAWVDAVIGMGSARDRERLVDDVRDRLRATGRNDSGRSTPDGAVRVVCVLVPKNPATPNVQSLIVWIEEFVAAPRPPPRSLPS